MILELEAIRKDLETEFKTTISPRDPIMMDLAAKRIELQIHLQKIGDLLNAHQTEASDNINKQFEQFRITFDSWINDAGVYLEQRIGQAGDRLVEKITALMPNASANSSPAIQGRSWLLPLGIGLFLLGFAIGHFT